MDWIDAENGEKIKKSAIIGIGKVRAVKVSSGKGQTLQEKTVYNFTIRIGTGGVIVRSPDYATKVGADMSYSMAKS